MATFVSSRFYWLAFYLLLLLYGVLDIRAFYRSTFALLLIGDFALLLLRLPGRSTVFDSSSTFSTTTFGSSFFTGDFDFWSTLLRLTCFADFSSNFFSSFAFDYLTLRVEIIDTFVTCCLLGLRRMADYCLGSSSAVFLERDLLVFF